MTLSVQWKERNHEALSFIMHHFCTTLLLNRSLLHATIRIIGNRIAGRPSAFIAAIDASNRTRAGNPENCICAASTAAEAK